MIYEIDFSKLKELKEKKYIPVLIILNKNIYTLLPNKTKFNTYLKDNKTNELLANIFNKLCKTFYYYYYNNNQITKDKINEYFDKPIVNDHIAFATKYENLTLYNYYSKKILSGKKLNINDSYIKFSIDGYTEINSLNVYNNLIIMKKIITETQINDFKLYIYEYNDDLNYDVITKEQKPIITKYLRRKTKFIKKDLNRYINKINGEVLSSFERLDYKINKEFNKKVFLCDIELNEDEEKDLFKYLSNELTKLTNTPNIDNYFPIRPKVFAVALVAFEAKYYGSSNARSGQNAFWSYFKKILNVDLSTVSNTVIKQRERIVEIFDKILTEKNKDKNVSLEYTERLENSRRNFERILVHSFVSTAYSTDLFDRLLLLWEQIYFSNYEEYFDTKESKEQLDSWIENNKEKAQIGNIVNGDIKLSTTLAFLYNKQSAKSKILRIIKFIDKSYYSMNIVPDSSRRLDHLLHLWMDNPKGKFKKLYKDNHSGERQRGKSLLFSPTIKFDNINNQFSLYFPQQFIKDYEGENAPIWEIYYKNTKKVIDPGLFTQEAGEYTKEVSLPLDDCDIFEKFKISLRSQNKVYKPYSILADNYRFFTATGNMLLPPFDFLPTGNIDIFSNSENTIKNSNNKIYKFSLFNKIYELNESFSENEILILSGGRVLKVGNKISECIDDISLIDNCFVKYNNETYDIYSKLPSLLFKNKKVKSVSLFINEIVNKVILDNPYKFDNNEDDIYGYIIDLNQYITNNGIYTIRLRNYRGDLKFNIAYINGFSYKFDGAPYIFKSEGNLLFPSNINIVTNNKWEMDFKFKSLNFSFDKNADNYYDRIEGQHMIVDYNMVGYKTPISIYLKIPALFWKFNENDEWSFRAIKDLSYKTMPSHIYLSAPFNLKKSYLSYDYLMDEDYIDKLTPDSTNKDYTVFNLNKIKNNINRASKENRKIYFNTKDQSELLFTMICKSKIISTPKIYGDFKNNKIIGKVEIAGDADYYSVEVYYESEDNLIGESNINKNGEFEIDYELQSGTYLLNFYENEDDEFGFGSESLKIGKTILTKIIDISNFENNSIYLNGFYNKSNIYEKVIDFGNNKYVINNLTKVLFEDYEDLIVDAIDENPVQIYTADFSYIHNDCTRKYIDCIIMFFDNYDISKNAILFKNDDEYSSMMFNKYKQMLLSEIDVENERNNFISKFRYSQNKSNMIYNNYLTLFAEFYSFDIDVK